MIHSIKGTIAELLPGIVVLENSGLGFELRVPDNSPAYALGPGESIRFYTAMMVREDDISLYGFTERHSLALFRQLLTVTGIGAKVALSLLSAMPLEELTRAIVFEDVATLMRANGVGKKTAQRIVLELKEKVEVPQGALAMDQAPPATGSLKDDALEALTALGFSKSEAMEALVGIQEADMTVEELIMAALRNR